MYWMISHSPAYKAMLIRLKKGRQDAKLSQVTVAERLGRPQSYVSKSENGERRVDPTELAEFADLYGKSLDYFLGRKES